MDCGRLRGRREGPRPANKPLQATAKSGPRLSAQVVRQSSKREDRASIDRSAMGEVMSMRWITRIFRRRQHLGGTHPSSPQGNSLAGGDASQHPSASTAKNTADTISCGKCGPIHAARICGGVAEKVIACSCGALVRIGSLKRSEPSTGGAGEKAPQANTVRQLEQPDSAAGTHSLTQPVTHKDSDLACCAT